MGVIAEMRAGSLRLFSSELKQNVELKVNSRPTVKKELPATFFLYLNTLDAAAASFKAPFFLFFSCHSRWVFALKRYFQKCG